MDRYKLIKRYGACTCGGRTLDHNQLYELCVCLDYYTLDVEYMSKVKAIQNAFAKNKRRK